MAIAGDTTSSCPGGAPSNVATWSHTVSGANRLLLVGVATVPNGIFSACSVTYNTTQTMTPVGTIQRYMTDLYAVELFSLVAPDTGTNNIVVTANAAIQNIGCGALSLTGVDQSTPLGTPNQTAVTTGALEVAVTSAAGELVVDVAACSWASVTLDADASQSQELETYFGNTSDGNKERRRIGMSDKSGAASVTMLWTGQNSDGSAIIAVPVKPAAASSVTWLRHRA